MRKMKVSHLLLFFFALNFSPICKSQLFMNLTEVNGTIWANRTTTRPQLNFTLWNLTTAASEPADCNKATTRALELEKSMLWNWNSTGNGTSRKERIVTKEDNLFPVSIRTSLTRAQNAHELKPWEGVLDASS